MSQEVGTISGVVKVVAPIVIEGGVYKIQNSVPGEVSEWRASVINNSSKEYMIMYNLTFGPDDSDPDAPVLTENPAEIEPYINGQKYSGGSKVLLSPKSKHDVLIKVVILPSCPVGAALRFDCRIKKGEEIIE